VELLKLPDPASLMCFSYTSRSIPRHGCSGLPAWGSGAVTVPDQTGAVAGSSAGSLPRA
jgi:hypothetical protein